MSGRSRRRATGVADLERGLTVSRSVKAAPAAAALESASRDEKTENETAPVLPARYL
ncbi:MAG TPA: hypothetical protein VF701_22150 [Thermoanaerobaculia bacterium]